MVHLQDGVRAGRLALHLPQQVFGDLASPRLELRPALLEGAHVPVPAAPAHMLCQVVPKSLGDRVVPREEGQDLRSLVLWVEAKVLVLDVEDLRRVDLREEFVGSEVVLEALAPLVRVLVPRLEPRDGVEGSSRISGQVDDLKVVRVPHVRLQEREPRADDLHEPHGSASAHSADINLG